MEWSAKFNPHKVAWDMWLDGPEFLRCEYCVLPRLNVEETLILSEVIEKSKKICEIVTNIVGLVTRF